MAISSPSVQQRQGPTPAQILNQQLSTAGSLLQKQQDINNIEKQRQFDNYMEFMGELAKQHDFGWAGIINNAPEMFNRVMRNQFPGMLPRDIDRIGIGLSSGAVNAENLMRASQTDLLKNLQRAVPDEAVEEFRRQQQEAAAAPTAAAPATAPAQPSGVESTLPEDRQRRITLETGAQPAAAAATGEQVSAPLPTRLEQAFLDEMNRIARAQGSSPEQAAAMIRGRTGEIVGDVTIGRPGEGGVRAGSPFTEELNALGGADRQRTVLGARERAFERFLKGETTVPGVEGGVVATAPTIDMQVMEATIGKGFANPQKAQEVSKLVSVEANATEGGNFYDQRNGVFVLNQSAENGTLHVGTASWHVAQKLAESDPDFKPTAENLQALSRWIIAANGLALGSFPAEARGTPLLVPRTVEELGLQVVKGVGVQAQPNVAATPVGQAVTANTNLNPDEVTVSGTLELTEAEAFNVFPEGVVLELQNMGLTNAEIRTLAQLEVQASIGLQRARDGHGTTADARIGHQKWMRGQRAHGEALAGSFARQYADAGTFNAIVDFIGGPDVVRQIVLSDQMPNFLEQRRLDLEERKLNEAANQFRVRLGLEMRRASAEADVNALMTELEMRKIALELLNAADPYTQSIRDDRAFVESFEKGFLTDKEGRLLSGDDWSKKQAELLRANSTYREARERLQAFFASSYAPDQVELITQLVTLDERGFFARTLRPNRPSPGGVPVTSVQVEPGAIPTQQAARSAVAGVPIGGGLPTGDIPPTVELDDVQAGAGGLQGLSPAAQQFLQQRAGRR